MQSEHVVFGIGKLVGRITYEPKPKPDGSVEVEMKSAKVGVLMDGEFVPLEVHDATER